MFGECHAHIFMNGYDYKKAKSDHKIKPSALLIKNTFVKYKEKGIFFIRDGGDNLSVSKEAKRISVEYGIDYRTPIFAIYKNGYYGKIVGRGFDNEKEYISLVREAKYSGCDFIKIMVSGILDFANEGNLSCDGLSKEDIKMMISIAHDEGFAVMAHANGSETVKIACDAGADSIEHGNLIDDEALMAMKESKTVFVPTISAIANLINTSRFPKETITNLTNKAKKNIKKAYKMGVYMALGSDAGAYSVFHAQGIYDEYAYFKSIFDEEDKIDAVLMTGEEKIKEKFKRS